MHEVAIRRMQPASIRLVDPMQFRFGQALKPGSHGWLEALGDKLKKLYVTKYMNFDPMEVRSLAHFH